MKKLYRKSTVHPTLTVPSDHHHLLSFLPAAILTLTAALSTEEREVLAYLISCSSSANFSGNHRKTAQKAAADHSPCFSCSCFRCYMSYWVKWDTSPNRQLIHEIIDAFEDSLLKEGGKKERNKRRKGKMVKVDDEPKLSFVKEDNLGFVVESKLESEVNGQGFEEADELEETNDDILYEEEYEKGSVRKIISFIGERIWSVWG